MPLLDCPVFAQQHEPELSALVDIYRARKPRRVLEIGTLDGGTFYHWLQGGPDIAVTVDQVIRNEALYPEWTLPGTHLEVIAGRSQDPSVFAAVKCFAPFDWIFIDADHAYEAVRADWLRYGPLCDGIIAFHDILPPSPQHPEIQVSKLWQQIKDAGHRTIELIDDPAAAWGGIGVVFLDERAA